MMKINRNQFWSNIFIEHLIHAGITNVVISPGSRNTALTLAIATHKKLHAISIIDERGAGFFALGLSKSIKKPVVLVCTSGTAVAEYYPAIIEAYQQRIPLIVCTADRPPHLIDTGANQTIRQSNIYKNHIRYFADCGLPAIVQKPVEKYKNKISAGLETALQTDRGPVHFNFPFEKPFEPDNFTDEISREQFRSLSAIHKPAMKIKPGSEPKISQSLSMRVQRELSSCKNPLILVGPGNFNEEFYTLCNAFAKTNNAVIFGDVASGIRFTTKKLSNVVVNYDTLLRYETIQPEIFPDVVIIFGRTMTSILVEKLLAKSSGFRIIVNEFGDRFDPTTSNRCIVNLNPSSFLKQILAASPKKEKQHNLLDFMKSRDSLIESRKKDFLLKEKSLSEAVVVNTITTALPDKSLLMLGNSLPVRDYDNFASPLSKRIIVEHNRGASGIDGITATGLGLAYDRMQPSFLVTGDVSFYYDINSLWIADKYKIPLIIFLMNNNGGRIFDMLPVSKFGETYQEYFVTPLHLDFKPLVQGFKGNYYKVTSRKELDNAIKKGLSLKSLTVIDIAIDPVFSADKRNELRNYITR